MQNKSATPYSSFVGDRTLHINYRQKTPVASRENISKWAWQAGWWELSICHWGSKMQYESIAVSLFTLTNARGICNLQFWPFRSFHSVQQFRARERLLAVYRSNNNNKQNLFGTGVTTNSTRNSPNSCFPSYPQKFTAPHRNRKGKFAGQLWIFENTFQT